MNECKNVKNVKMMLLNGAINAKHVKNCLIIIKNVTKYMKIANVIFNIQK